MIWLLLPAAFATRPDDGGLYSFEDDDVLEAVDGPLGLVRVTYSVEGPNVTILDDEDGTGYPDFAEEVAATAEDVLALYEATGFLSPVSEEDMGLAPLGGSYAFDFYLVDFAGVADGQFSVDDCAGDVCSGFMVMENDFSGYGYRSLTQAIQVLTSHELFHAVQAAYNASQPGWMSEGTAVWAEYLYNPAVDDFIYFCDEYLADTERPIDRPPAGVSSFIYSTALFWAYLDARFGPTSMVELQEAMTVYDPEEEGVTAFTSVIEANGSTLSDEWFRFASWNLATGQRAGVLESYEFAADLGGVTASESGDELVLDHRFYPLAASYFRVSWDGGPMWWNTAEDPTGLVFALHPVSDGSNNGPVDEAVMTWAPTSSGRFELGELPEGTYWLLGTFPEVADNSTKVAFCLGSEASVAACDPVEDSADTAADTGGEGPKDDGACGCASGGVGAGWAALIAGLALGRRRHRPPAR